MSVSWCYGEGGGGRGEECLINRILLSLGDRWACDQDAYIKVEREGGDN